MLKLIFILSSFLTSLSHATSSSNSDVQNSQMATLTERMNQMLSSLYLPPLLPKPSPSPQTTMSNDSPTTTHESPNYSYPGYSIPGPTSQIFYIPPFPTSAALLPYPGCYLDPNLQRFDYGYTGKSNHYPQPAYPYGYDYNYPQFPNPPVPYIPAPCPPPYTHQYPPLPKANCYPFPDYPGPHQSRPISPPGPPLPSYHAPAAPYPTPYYNMSPQPSPPPISFYPQPPYHKPDIMPPPNYP